MNAVILLLAPIFSLMAAHALAAQPGTSAPEAVKFLDDSGLHKAFVGQTHVGFYRDYLERYGSIRFVETYFADGTLAYQGGAISIGGSWEIIDGRICFDYDSPEFLPGCFGVSANKGCYYSHESSHPDDGVQTIANQWWIFSHVQGASVECSEAELVS